MATSIQYNKHYIIADTTSCFGLCPSSNILLKHNVSQAGCNPSSGKDVPNQAFP